MICVAKWASMLLIAAVVASLI